MDGGGQTSGPESKRQRREHLTAHSAGLDAAAAPSPQHSAGQQGPWVTTLFQVPAGLPREPSPGAMHGCRIATWIDGDANSPGSYGSVLASGRHVYWSQLLLPHQQLQPDQQGKEGVLLPLRVQAPAVMQLHQLPQHAGEVQSLALCRISSTEQSSEFLLGTVDAYGAGSISRVRPSLQYDPLPAAVADPSASDAASALPAAAGPAAGPEVVLQAQIRPMDACREGGWAGVTFSGSSSSTAAGASASAEATPAVATEPRLLATARCFAKDACVYDVPTGKALRSFACTQNPYALSFLPAGILGSGDSNMLAVAEGHSVCVWDVRAAGATGGCIQRYSPGALGQPLYAIAWSSAQAGLLGAAGAERSLFLTEPRKWRVVTKWQGATRLAVHHLAFLDTDPRYAVLAGLDLEVVCGRWDAPGSNARPFESTRQAEEAAAAAAAAGGGGGGDGKQGAGAAPAHAAPGAPGSGDRSRRGGSGTPAATAAAGGGGGGVMHIDDAEGSGSRPAGVLSFRGDGRWLGVAKAAGVDVLAGFAASGNLVYARIA